ncbi:MAG: potassium channel protein [Candidatus Aminicenantes bacterium]|nr:potassium channel protein [Candidatus Aminicenantes bacterium]
MGSKKRLVTALILFAAVFVLGVAGFKVLGGTEWTLMDAVYMTVITVATIGYGEVHDLGAQPEARVFAVVYIIICLGTIAFAVSSITAFVVEGELRHLLGRRKMEKAIAKLSGHYIVCGSDETAQTVVRELLQTKKPFVVVDPSKERVDKMLELGLILWVQGDPAEDDVLEKAGIGRARGLLCSLATDEANLFVLVTAKGLNPTLRVVAKGIDVRSHAKMRKAGADSVISPTFIGGMRMVSEMIRPATTTFLDLMLRERDRVLRFDEVTIPAGSPLAGKTVGEADFEAKTGALFVARRRGGKKDFDFNPGKTAVLETGDVLVFITTPEMLAEIEKIAGGTVPEPIPAV